jgi:hypothetical protein
MDDSVLAAIAKWPNVPAVFGWLLLTARGEWRIKGEPIANEAIRDFIGRNYAADERGRWYFQNGPQRVYVALEAAPWIWRIHPGKGAHETRTHTEARARRLLGAWLDEAGRVYLQTELGFGLVESSDAAAVAAAFTTADRRAIGHAELDAWLAGRGPPIVVSGALTGLVGDADLGRLRAAEAPRRFGFVCLPQPD